MVSGGKEVSSEIIGIVGGRIVEMGEEVLRGGIEGLRLRWLDVLLVLRWFGVCIRWF